MPDTPAPTSPSRGGAALDPQAIDDALADVLAHSNAIGWGLYALELCSNRKELRHHETIVEALHSLAAMRDRSFPVLTALRAALPDVMAAVRTADVWHEREMDAERRATAAESEATRLRADLARVTQERDNLVRAIDEALITAHAGTFDLGNDPKLAINTLMVHAESVGEYFARQQRKDICGARGKNGGRCTEPARWEVYSRRVRGSCWIRRCDRHAEGWESRSKRPYNPDAAGAAGDAHG